VLEADGSVELRVEAGLGLLGKQSDDRFGDFGNGGVGVAANFILEQPAED
jgi:hypothetical protein